MGGMKKPILSFTSHKARLPFIDDVFRSHLTNSKACGMDVCFACQDDSLPAMTEYQRSLVDLGKIELLHVPKDHGSNTKWTLCRAAHPDATMVVVDDDELYPPSAFPSLLHWSGKLPGAFLCRSWRRLSWSSADRMVPFTPNVKGPDAPNPVYLGNGLFVPSPLTQTEAIPEHWAGCLYPPGFPDPAVAQEAAARAYHDDDAFMMLLLARTKTPFYVIPVTERNTRLATKRSSPLYGSALAHQPGFPGARTRAALAGLESELASLRR
jgi:hypothetical protein